MSRKLFGVERLEPRCVLSVGIGSADDGAEPVSLVEITLGQTTLVDVQPMIVAGALNGSPPDSPALRVDSNLSTSPYAGVGSLEIRSGSSTYICSASVIGPRHVLTAGHCVDLNDDGSPDALPQDVIFHLNFGGSLTHAIPAADVFVHPNFSGFANPAVNDDLAVIQLSSDVPAGVPIYALNTSPASAGQQVTAVGYGLSGDGVNGYTVNPAFDVKRKGSNRTDDFDPDDEGSGSTEVFVADFDGPTTATNFIGGTTLGNTIETTLGGGDSGGPSFVDQSGTLLLYGINTFTTRFRRSNFSLGPTAPLFGSGFGGIVVAPYADWITSLIGTNGDIRPSVEITSPADLATVSGASVPILASASASDDNGVTRVEFFVDGTSIGVDTNGGDGWSVNWDLTSVADGSRTIGAVATDTIGQTDSDSIVVFVDNHDDPTRLYFALGTGATVGGVNVARDDIAAWDGTSFSLFFDGSDVGLTDAFGTLTIDAFSIISPNEILFSFAEPGGVIGFGSFDDSDVVKFTATSLGQNTAGSWSYYFDGSDVGLTQNSEDIDGIELLPNGRLLISTTGSVSVSGASGQDEDLLQFVPSSLGSNTSGTWSMYFDGSDVGLSNSSENVDGVAVGAGGEIYLSTAGNFSVPGVSGANEDVFVFRPTRTGGTTQGSYDGTLYFDGSTVGLAALDLKAIDVPATTAPASAAVRARISHLVEVARTDVPLAGASVSRLAAILLPVESTSRPFPGGGGVGRQVEAESDSGPLGTTFTVWSAVSESEPTAYFRQVVPDNLARDKLSRDNDDITDALFRELGEADDLSCRESLGLADAE